MAERRRLDSLDATQVAELYLTTTDPGDSWLIGEPYYYQQSACQ